MSLTYIKQLAAAPPKSIQDNKKELDYLRKITNDNSKIGEIAALFNQHPDAWESIWVKEGNDNDVLKLSNDVIEKANGKENIITLIAIGSSKIARLLYQVKNYADDHTFTSALELPDNKTAILLFFFKSSLIEINQV